MNTLSKIFGLKKEAVLLDSGLYIAKAMCAISVGYVLGNAFSITRLDMISVLLGVMYNLEPINVSGLKGGLNQLFASTIGALITGFLVYIMGYQITFVTVALGIGLTLYVSLKIDYRMVSPVAIFTSIYMTQLLQTNDLGQPSVLLTFRLRILALGLGIGIALFFNFLFSIIYYKQIGRKRVEFVKIQTIKALNHTISGLENNDLSSNTEFILASTFNDVDMVKSNLESMMKEKYIPFNQKEKARLNDLYEIVMHMKNMTHCAYDCLFIANTRQDTIEPQDLDAMRTLVTKLEEIDFLNVNKSEQNIEIPENDNGTRMHQNTQLMVRECATIQTIYNSLD